MAKDRVSLSIETDVVSKIETYNRETFPGLSQSAVVEILLRDALSRVFLPQAGSSYLEVDVGGDKKVSTLDDEK